MSARRSDVVFFFGAGASVPARLKDTRDLAKGFLDEESASANGNAARKVADVLIKTLGSDPLDIEILLDALERLAVGSQDPLMRAIGPQLGVSEELASDTAQSLKLYIRKALSVDTKRTRYLKPLLQFLQDAPNIDIITVNYDTVVEQFCDAYGIRCEDGFDVRWSPSRFDTLDSGVRLYKLHGSILWYTTGRGSYLKIPIRTESQVTLFTGETAENLMLYPAQKLGLEEPFLDILGRVKKVLADPETKFLVVVGYSFRDRHIVQFLWDAAIQNRNLTVLLVDPSAGEINRKRLVFSGSQLLRAPSSLYNRVVCLPYRFEGVFPTLKKDYLENLRLGLTDERQQRDHAIAGESTNWLNAFVHLAEAEAAEKVVQLVHRAHAPMRGINRLCRARISILLALNLGLNRDRRGRRYARDFYVMLRSAVVDGVLVEPVSSSEPVRIFIGSRTTNGGWSSEADSNQFIKWCKNARSCLETRSNWASEQPDYLGKMHSLIVEIENYFDEAASKANTQEYLKARAKRNPAFMEFEPIITGDYDSEKWAEMRRLLSTLERKELAAIFDKYAELMGELRSQI